MISRSGPEIAMKLSMMLNYFIFLFLFIDCWDYRHELLWESNKGVLVCQESIPPTELRLQSLALISFKSFFPSMCRGDMDQLPFGLDSSVPITL